MGPRSKEFSETRIATGWVAIGAGAVALVVAQSALASDPWAHLSVGPSSAPTPAGHYAGHPAIVSAMLPAVVDEIDEGSDEEPTSLQRARSVACLVTGGTATAAALAFG